MRKLILLLILIGCPVTAFTQLAARDSAINIITYWPTGFTVNPATTQGQRVQRILQHIQTLGIKTVILNFRGVMITGTTNEVSSVVLQEQWTSEEQEVKALAAYAKTLGLHVAFRPILLVVGPNYEFPYQVDGYYWWHGVIKPTEPEKWFESYFKFHERYMRLAHEVNAIWYSIGAEMHSMTSGLGSRDNQRQFGYPALWLKFIDKARPILQSTKITYGANYTDQYVLENGQRTWGGELEQWRYYLTNTATTTQEIEHQSNLRKLWLEIDFMGIDFYRSLGSEHTIYPDNFTDLSNVLQETTDLLGAELKAMNQQIEATTGVKKELHLQEIGYRSVEQSFVKPYVYEGDGAEINFMHQASAWEAVLRTFWNPVDPIVTGIGIWQILVDEDTDLKPNGGFSPLGKPLTEEVLRQHFHSPTDYLH
jgi:hypothetical protein